MSRPQSQLNCEYSKYANIARLYICRSVGKLFDYDSVIKSRPSTIHADYTLGCTVHIL